jgi:hypothetical protein
VSVAVAAGRGGQQPPGQLANMSAACRQAWQGLLQVAAVLGTAPN